MTSIAERVVDWWSKGLQLSACYKEDWEYIKSIFYKLHLSIDCHSPLITMHELSNVRYAYELSKRMNHPEISQPNLFLLILRAFPIYSRIYSRQQFERDINPTLLGELLSVDGTIKETDSEYARILEKVINDGKKSNNHTRKSINISIRN